MTVYDKVRSTVKPDAVKIDEYSVWVKTDITRTTSGWTYHLVQYSKDEYLALMDEKNAALEEQLTDTQLALCDVYEMIGG